MNHDIAITNATNYKTIVFQGFCCNTSVSILNKGGFTETFNVTIYLNETEVTSHTVDSLPNGTSTILELQWFAPVDAIGNYTISVVAGPVEGETNMTDNEFIVGSIAVTICGDIDLDCDCDIFDIIKIIDPYGTCEGDQKFNPNSDFDCDGCVKIFDITMVTPCYGTRCP